MSTSLKATVDRSFAFGGQKFKFVSENTLTFSSGNALKFFSVDGEGQHTFIWNPSSRGLSAITTNPRTRTVVFAGRGRNPAISVYRFPEKQLVAALTDGSETEFTAIACSRDGSRVAGFGGLSDYKLTIWDVEKQEKLFGAEINNSCPCIAAEFNPSDPSELLSLFEDGTLCFWKITRSYQQYRLEKTELVTRPKREAAPKDPLFSVRTAREPEATEDVDIRSATWSSFTWGVHGRVYAANLKGEIYVFNSKDSCRLMTRSPGTGGVVISAMCMSREHLVLGCEDGTVRRLSLMDLSEVSSTIMRNPDGPLLGMEVAPIVALCPTPSYSKVYIASSIGLLAWMQLDVDEGEEQDDAQEAPELDDTLHYVYDSHAGAVIGVASVVMDSDGDSAEEEAEPHIASIGSDRTLRLWNVASGEQLCKRTFKHIPAPNVRIADAVEKQRKADEEERTLEEVEEAFLQHQAADTLNPDVVAPEGGAAAEGGDELEAKETEEQEQSTATTVTETALLTALAAHPALPVVAVGGEDGRLRVVLLRRNPGSDDGSDSGGRGFKDEVPGTLRSPVVALTIHGEWIHDGCLSALAFCPDPMIPLLATASVADRRICILDTRLPASAADGLTDGRGLDGFRIVAYTHLPEGIHKTPLGLAWRLHGSKQAELVVTLDTGEVMSVALPPAALALLSDSVTSNRPMNQLARPEPLERHSAVRFTLPVQASAVVCEFDSTAEKQHCLYAAGPLEKGLMAATVEWDLGSKGGATVASLVKQGEEAKSEHAMAPPASSVVMFDGHSNGILCVASARLGAPDDGNAVVLVATGGADGAVSVWAAQGQKLIGSQILRIHSAPVIAVALGRNAKTVYSAGLDGAIHVVSLSGQVVDAFQGASAVPEPCRALLKNYQSVARALVPLEEGNIMDFLLQAGDPSDSEGEGDDAAPSKQTSPIRRSLLDLFHQREALVDAAGSSEGTFFERVLEAEAEALAIEDEESRKEMREKVVVLQNRLNELLEANQKAAELERLDREEFVIDKEGKKWLLGEINKRIEDLRQKLQSGIEEMDKEAQAIKEKCWDSMEVHLTAVKAFHSPTLVYNFPMRKRSPAYMSEFNRLTTLRRIELLDLGKSPEADTKRKMWKGLADELPSNIEWLLGAGLLPPTVDPIEQRQELERIKSESSKANKEAKRGAKGKEEGKEEEEVMAHEAGEEEDDAASVSSEQHEPEFWGKEIIQLLYHPLSIRTPNQKRMQIMFLGELARGMRERFNERFKELQAAKLDDMDKIESRNQRIAEIMKELETEESYFKPKLSDEEVPERVLEVQPQEVGTERYIPVAERKRMEEEAERKRKEAAEKKDDAPERALDEMMGGTLEAKDELAKLEEGLVREPWMDELSLAEMTEEQRQKLEEFEEKQKQFEEERQKYKLALQQEMRKLKAEVKEIVKGFDEKIEEVLGFYLETEGAIYAQELYALRLALSVQSREVNLRKDHDLEAQLERLEAEEGQVQTIHDEFQQQVESKQKHLAELVKNEQLSERQFKQGLQAALPPGRAPLDQDTIRILQSLYRQRHTTERAEPSLAGPSVDSAGLQRLSDPSKEDSNASGKEASVLSTASALDPFHGTEVNPISEEDAKAKEHAEMLKPLPNTDCPETLDLHDPMDAEVWKVFNDMRIAKIQLEIDVELETKVLNDMAAHLDLLATKLERLSMEIQQCEKEMAVVATDRDMNTANCEVLVTLNQGNVEIEQEVVATDYSRSVLIPVDIVHRINSRIREVGADKVAALEKIKSFRKRINYMVWESGYLKAKAMDREEHYTDLHMLRVTKTLQEFIKGGDMMEKNKKDLEKAEARAQHNKDAHARTMAKLQKQMRQLQKQIKEKEKENNRLRSSQVQLNDTVKVREQLHKTRIETQGGSTDPRLAARKRIQAITTRRKLIDLAKAQTEEIAFLRTELDRLRKRTFPTFAAASQLVQGGVDDR